MVSCSRAPRARRRRLARFIEEQRAGDGARVEALVHHQRGRYSWLRDQLRLGCPPGDLEVSEVTTKQETAECARLARREHIGGAFDGLDHPMDEHVHGLEIGDGKYIHVYEPDEDRRRWVYLGLMRMTHTRPDRAFGTCRPGSAAADAHHPRSST